MSNRNDLNSRDSIGSRDSMGSRGDMSGSVMLDLTSPKQQPQSQVHMGGSGGMASRDSMGNRESRGSRCDMSGSAMLNLTSPQYKLQNQVQNQSQSQSQIVFSEIYLKTLLLKYFGFEDFRFGQLNAVTEITNGRDVAIFWSTGSGKSLCYVLPALARKKVTIPNPNLYP
jgi:hypothetical protein